MTATTRHYLDWNASAPLEPVARAAMLAAVDILGNPSSVHAEGRRAREAIEAARENVAAMVGARPADVVFTSGATEANATVLAGGWDTIIASRIEHDSVLAPIKQAAARHVDIPAFPSGIVDVAAIAQEVLRGAHPLGRSLVSLQMANNETGVLQPVADVAEFARNYGIVSHTDAVQAAGRVAIDIEALGVDFLTLSSHKIGGPKGVGALVIRNGARLPALLAGGGQERGRRAGTENLPAIVGFGAAAVIARKHVGDTAAIASRRDRLERLVLAATPDARIIGAASPRLANTTSIALAGHLAETLVIKFDLAGIAVSAGAACSSGKVGTSPVLTAMGLDVSLARGAIRVSIGATTTDADIEAFGVAWNNITRSARKAA